MFKQISSTQNPLIKELIQLKEKSRARKKSKRFIIEGKREISLALQGNYTIEKILFDSSIISSIDIKNGYSDTNIECIDIASEVYEKISYRSSTEGIVAIAQFKELWRLCAQRDLELSNL